MSWRAHLEGSGLTWPVRPALGALPSGDSLPDIETLDRVLGEKARVRFVPSSRVDGGAWARRRRKAPITPETRYDARVTTRAEVPTRKDNLHDVMNALVWSAFPASKRALHARQHRLVGERLDQDGRRLVPHRSREQDEIAMLDEGGILVLAKKSAAADVARALEAREEATLAEATRCGDSFGVVFGHALYEHIARAEPRTVWGKAVLFEVDAPSALVDLGHLDARLAEMIMDPEQFAGSSAAGSAPLAPSVLGTDAS